MASSKDVQTEVQSLALVANPVRTSLTSSFILKKTTTNVCGIFPCLCYNKFFKFTLPFFFLIIICSRSIANCKPLHFQINYTCKNPFRII